MGNAKSRRSRRFQFFFNLGSSGRRYTLTCARMTLAIALVGQALALLLQGQNPHVSSLQHVSCGKLLSQGRPFTIHMALSDQERRISKAMELQKPETLTESARSKGLSLALDDGTRKSHSVAENTAFVTGFFRGIATKSSFSQLVFALYHVYTAMEEAFDACTDPNVQAPDFPELRRASSLMDDMEYYFGSTWRQKAVPSAATRKYVGRVQQVARDEPYLLVAHMYTRYLGDLFGGQMMGGMARRSLTLPKTLGTDFYDFEQIPNTKGFIEAWYRELNLLSLTEAQKEAIVDEGNLVFKLNIDVFAELEGSPVRALLKLAYNQLRKALRLPHTK